SPPPASSSHPPAQLPAGRPILFPFPLCLPFDPRHLACPSAPHCPSDPSPVRIASLHLSPPDGRLASAWSESATAAAAIGLPVCLAPVAIDFQPWTVAFDPQSSLSIVLAIAAWSPAIVISSPSAPTSVLATSTPISRPIGPSISRPSFAPDPLNSARPATSSPATTQASAADSAAIVAGPC